jgi:hypothetical protein
VKQAALGVDSISIIWSHEPPHHSKGVLIYLFLLGDFLAFDAGLLREFVVSEAVEVGGAQ